VTGPCKETLAIWMMFLMTFPSFVDTSIFAVKSSYSVMALWVVSSLFLATHGAVLIYHFYKVVKYEHNPLKLKYILICLVIRE
jgi:hypothetical protein